MGNTREKIYRDYLGSLASQGMRRQAEKGRLTGPAPLGYRNGAGGSSVALDEKAARLVKRSFELVGIEGLSLRKALVAVTEEGLLSKRGKPLSFSSFQEMVTNPFYCGYVRLNGELFEGRHEPLISRELFGMVQGRLRERQHRLHPLV